MRATEKAELLKVGDLARKSGKTVRALHLYEELGLVRPVSRTSGGFRLFDEDALRRIHWIGLLQEMGLSLHQIQDLLRDWWGNERGPEAMDRLRKVFESKLIEARQQVRKYELLARELESSLHYFETCRSCHPAPQVETCTRCPRDHGMVEEPLLVAGLRMRIGKRAVPGAMNGGGGDGGLVQIQTDMAGPVRRETDVSTEDFEE